MRYSQNIVLKNVNVKNVVKNCIKNISVKKLKKHCVKNIKKLSSILNSNILTQF